MASQNTSRYHVVPPHEDDERDSSPHDRLLPTISPQNFNNTWSFTLNPTVVFRGLSTLLALIAFIIFCVDGGDEFIAADIFLMITIIANMLILIHYTVSHLVKVTVEVREQSFALGNKNKPKVTMYLDLGFAAALALSLIIGNAVKWYGGAWKGAVVLGYIVVLLQVLLVIPGLETKSLTITLKLNDLQGKYVPDTKLPTHTSTVLGGADLGAARRRTPEADEPRQSPVTGEDLV